MKIFLFMIALLSIGLLYGVLEAVGRGIPITVETTPWEGILALVLLIVAWWLSRRKGDSDHTE